MSHLEMSANSEDDADDVVDVADGADDRYKSSLFRLAERGDYSTMCSMLMKERIAVDRLLTDNGDTALHVAASAGNLGTTTALLSAGARVNFRGHRRRTPLHSAAAHGHLAVARGLLGQGAEIAAKDADGLTPLELAKRNGREEVVRMLQERIDRQSDVKLMATAVSQGDMASVEMFLEKGLSADECNERGEPLLVLAAEAKRWEVVNLLLEKGASPTMCKRDTKCALVFASRDGQADVVRHLLRRGAESNAQQVTEALGVASSAAVVQAFVDVVPNHVRGNRGSSGLLDAAWNGRLDPLVALLDAGANVNVHNTINQTPLFLASSNGDIECVRELLRRGADANAVGYGGNTPLHMACKHGHAECVRELLAAGASTLERNYADEIPLEVAMTDEVRRIFAEHSVKSESRNVSK